MAGPIKDVQRLGHLDSLRGLAALMVVLFHCNLMTASAFPAPHQDLVDTAFSIPGLSFYGLALFLEAGRSAVMIFFVLSGFVLAYSLLKQPTPYAGFILKRVFRIYPPFLLVVLSSYALHSFIGVRHGVQSPWLWGEIHPDLSFSMLLKNLALWSTEGSNGLDRVIWSLVHEVRVSLVFPFMLFTVVKYGWRGLLAYGAISVVCTMWLFHMTGTVALGYEEKTFAMTFLDTGYYAVFFAGGAFMAIEREWIISKVANMPQWIQGVLCITAAYCLLKPEYSIHTQAGCLNDYIRGAGAIVLIALALGAGRLRNALNHGVLIWLGRISYSLYLVHCPILYVVSQTFGASWSVIQTSAAVIVLSLITAEAMARWIEFPSIRFGRKLGARYAKLQPA